MTIIQELMQIDRGARSYSSVAYGWLYNNTIDCNWQTWNNIYDYLRSN